MQLYTLFGVSCTILLLLLFLAQLLAALRLFASIKKTNRMDAKEAANEVLFFSFVGATIYGHGEVRGLHWLSKILASLLADTLFIIVCGKLLLVLSCSYPSGMEPTLLVDSRVQCWTGDHSYYACAALIALGYYVPFCAMLGPMFRERPEDTLRAAEKKAKKKEEKASRKEAKRRRKQSGKEEEETLKIASLDGHDSGETGVKDAILKEKADISFIQPFLTVITVTVSTPLIFFRFCELFIYFRRAQANMYRPRFRLFYFPLPDWLDTDPAPFLSLLYSFSS